METIVWPTENTAEAFLIIFHTFFFSVFKLPPEVGEYFLIGEKKRIQHNFDQLELMVVMQRITFWKRDLKGLEEEPSDI